MPDNGGTAHSKRRRLGTELRVLREVNRFSGRELAQRIGISQSRLSRIETGIALPSIAEAKAWTRAVGATAETGALLERLTDAARTEVETLYDALEGRKNLQQDSLLGGAPVRRTRTFEPNLVPGLLQTPDYAQRVLTMFQRLMPQVDVPSSAAERINRQSTVYEEDKEFEFLIGEAALRWRPGPPRLLLAQLDRIATMSTKDNVAIGLIPLLAIEATGALHHPYTIYELGDDTNGSVVQVETVHAELTVKAPDDVAAYERQWSSHREMARFGNDARILLKELSTAVISLENSR